MIKRNLALLLALTVSLAYGQDRKNGRDVPENLDKIAGIEDRAGGVHNVSNIALFFENRGKLYPRRISQGPSGEFPPNSGKHYIYRVNPMVGVPGNVVQGRYTTNEEWEAVEGYYNRELARIAFSDNPKTWHPVNGWPVKDAQGNPIFKSDQDSYCVYSDSNNAREALGVTIAQTGYAYGVSFARNLLFFKYDVINTGAKNLDSLYFSLYTDIDIGNISGGVPEYGDDRIGFIKEENFLYFFDDGESIEWPGGKTGYFGVAFLRTPQVNGIELGVTDMHYNLYNDDSDQDSVQYGIMASSASLFNSNIGSRYFHLGNNAGLNFDDPATIPETGLDVVANVSSGPYVLNPGDTLTFYTVFVAGETESEMFESLKQANRIVDFNFEISKPPAAPNVSVIGGDGRAAIYWDDSAEDTKDNFSGEFDFEGYRVYRSQDRGVTWRELADYDLINNLGVDLGLQYSYIDSTITNGFEYWYTVTSYDRGDSIVASLESPKGNTIDAPNLVSVTPQSKALGYEPVSAGGVLSVGPGGSNYELHIQSKDTLSLVDNDYTIGFTYISRKTRGNLNTVSTITVEDSTRAQPLDYRVEFLSPDQLRFVELASGDEVGANPKNYNSGLRINVRDRNINVITIELNDPDPDANPDLLPQFGDQITYYYSIYAIRNGTDTVMSPRPFNVGQSQSTGDGVIFKIQPPELIQNVSRVGGSAMFEIEFFVFDEALILDTTYTVEITGNGSNSNGDRFVSLIVKSEAGDTTVIVDTLYNLEYFEFDGVEGQITFNAASPPGPGNIYSVTTISPKPPTIQDAFQFEMQAPKIDKGKISAGMSNIKVVPNPYVVTSLYEPEFGELRREPLRQLQFINLPNECDIYIFSIDADLVKKIAHNSNSGTATWDLRSESGREIAPGVYLYVVKTKEEEYLSRFAVIK